MAKFYLKVYKRKNKTLVGNLSKRSKRKGKAIRVLEIRY